MDSWSYSNLIYVKQGPGLVKPAAVASGARLTGKVADPVERKERGREKVSRSVAQSLNIKNSSKGHI